MRFKKASLALVCLLFASALLVLLASAPPAIALENYENVVIQGSATAYTTDITPPPPWQSYSAGDLPPIMVAKRVGSGKVVASGTVATSRGDGSQRWTLGEYDVLLDKMFRWMKPDNTAPIKVLWYEGYDVYNTIQKIPAGASQAQCPALAEALRAKGYTVTGDDTEPITDALLAPYDILVIPQLQLGSNGGDPNLLPDNDVQAIKSFVEGGKGLFIMEGSDYGGYNFYKVQNKILENLNFGLYFQSDQISDPGFSLTANINTTNEIGAAYQAETGKSTIALYSICSLAGPSEFSVEVSIPSLSKSGKAGETLTYTVTINNTGSNDIYSLEATNDAGWAASASPTSLEVQAGEEGTVTLSVKIPNNAAAGDYTFVTVTATSQGDPGISSSARTGAEVPEKFELGKWTTASSLFPYVPDYGVTVAGAGENIYITNTSQFLRYNTTTGEWQNLSIPGVFMNGSSLIWDENNYIYALGGGSYRMCTEVASRRYSFWRYNISSDEWDTVADTPWYQGPGCALALAKVGGKKYLYAFLGTSSRSGSPEGYELGNYYPEGVQFWRYNIDNDEWDENLAPNPYGADDGANLVWTGEDYIYAFPGAYDEGLPPEAERYFLRYSISIDSWEEMAKTPFNGIGGIDDGGALVWPGGDYIYALKGGSDPPGGDVPGDNFWRYSISNNEWEILPNLPAGVGVNNGRRLGIANGNIYCWRGSYNDGTLWVYGLVGVPQPDGTPWVYVVAAAAAIVIIILALVKFKLLKPKRRKTR